MKCSQKILANASKGAAEPNCWRRPGLLCDPGCQSWAAPAGIQRGDRCKVIPNHIIFLAKTFEISVRCPIRENPWPSIAIS